MLDLLPQILFWLLVALFGLAVLVKISGKLKEKYAEWGYGTTFMYALAAVELIATVGLFSSYDEYAAWFLVAIMGGAFFTLFKNGEAAKEFVLPIISTLLLGSFLYCKSAGLL